MQKPRTGSDRLLARAVAVILAIAPSGPPLTAAGSSSVRPAVRSSQLQEVRIDRRRPVVVPPPPTPVFSHAPETREISAARVFEEPLLAVGVGPSAAENAFLARALTAYLALGGRDRVEPLRAFLADHPDSPWRPSLLANLGIVFRRTGYFSRALEAWEEAWALTRASADPNARPVGDRAIGELFDLNARLGRFDTLEQLFQEIAGRDVRGAAAAKISGARQALWLMRNAPEHAFRCGPLALDQVLRHGRGDYETPEAVGAFPSSSRGTSLVQMRDLAASAGRPLAMAFRPAGAAVIVPAMVHWKVGHFAAIVDQSAQGVLVRDATFGDEFWVSRAALDAEASGYVLVAGQPLPDAWRPADEIEGAAVWGKGHPTANDPTDAGPGSPECGGGGNCGGGGGGASGGSGRGPDLGMAVVSLHMMLVATNVRDTPLWYTPPRGPALNFQVRYYQRDTAQPQAFPYANLGSKWTFDWLSYVEDDPANPSAAVKVYFRGGGQETSTGYSPATQRYAPTVRTQAVIARRSADPIRYERELPDGSVEVFAQPDGVATFPRKVFMTEMRDPQGNAVTFTWDSELRLVAATDAIGQVTTLSYEHASDPRKITRVTDPFGRTATFAYGPDGRLASITDILGLTSAFTYGPADAVTAVTTPYGTTAILYGEENLRRWAELTDPLGAKERLEYGIALPSAEGQLAPAGMYVPSSLFGALNNTTFYWDARAMAVAPGQPSSATQYVWALVSSGLAQTSSAVFGLKKPLETWVWTNYHGTGNATEGSLRKPAKRGRRLDDGTSQVEAYDYNARGLPTRRVDALGRETAYEYAANGLDVTVVKQKNGAGRDVLETRTYDARHRPLTVTDAAGQTTTSTYNAAGQVLTVTNAKSETTTSAYDADGRLQTITGPVAGATTTFTYDALSRVRTVTDPDAYTVTTDYDAAGRATRTTYPDGTFEETTYHRLDAVRRRDRLGRVTHAFYDAARRLTATRDPLGRTVTQAWCTCGTLDALVDAAGHATRWERDVQARVTKEVRADGRDTLYTYETTTSRLRSVTDAKQQVTTYTYFPDDRLQAIVFTNEALATPDVQFTYDPVYGRLATMADGTGTTAYAYHGIPALGATHLASVDGPLPTDTITYGYDELGRVTTRAIDGVGVTWSFDALGRVTSEANVLGTFAYTYEGPTARVATVTYPNGQTSTYGYDPTAQDHRLQTIHHRYPTGATLSRFDYTYDAVGNIRTWRQQADTTAVSWTYGYDAADQLTAAVKRATDPPQTVLQRYAYAYDAAGNRTGEQIDDQVTGWTYNAVNELVTQHAAGGMVFEGTVSEPATVTIAGQPASVSPANEFRGTAPVTADTSPVTVTATDASGNVAMQQYAVPNSATAKSFTYDANGNLTNDGTRTFEWDARNQLVAVTVGTQRTEFTYDGRQRRVRIVEKDSGVTQSDTKLVWCENEICEERAADGTTVRRRAFERGEQVASSARFFAGDHLGSVEEVTDGTSAVLARYAFDPSGRRTVTTGTDVTSVGYAGYRWHSNGSVSLTLYRGYDAHMGRWVSQDPIGSQGGSNFFAYAENNPVRFNDPLGLAIWICTRKAFTKNGPGNHSYFWNDKKGTCCGMGSTTSCSEGGPTKDSCRKVAGSDGFEEELLKCCRGTSDAGTWFPYLNDCQQGLDDCLSKMKFKNPGSPGGRWGDPCDPCDKKK